MGAEDWIRYTDEIRETLRKWGVTHEVSPIKSHVAKLDGNGRRRFWRQSVYLPEERSISVAFSWRERGKPPTERRQVEFTMHAFPTPWENAEALAKALEALRLAEGRGSLRVMMKLLRQMFPQPTFTEGAGNAWDFVGGSSRRYNDGRQQQRPPDPLPEWRRILHIGMDAPLEVAEAAYRALAREAHPDRGGSHDRMKQLNRAIEQARNELARAS
jgi:hypothetical protein